MNNVNVKMMYKCECNAIQQSTHHTHNVITWQSESKLSGIHFNSLLPVSRYIDTAFADKGSHQKKIYNQNVRTHLSSDY